MLKFQLSSTDSKQLDVALRTVLDALPAGEREAAEVTLLPRAGERLRRQLALVGESDKIARNVALLSLPSDVDISVRLPE